MLNPFISESHVDSESVSDTDAQQACPADNIVPDDDDDDEVVPGPRVQAEVKLAATVCTCSNALANIMKSSR